VALALEHQRLRDRVVVLDPYPGENAWGPKAVVFSDPEKFDHFVASTSGCVLIVDESGRFIQTRHSHMTWLATEARHLGHTTYFLTQSATQLPPVVRENVSTCWLFATGKGTKLALQDEMFDWPEIRSTRLTPYHFLYLTTHNAPRPGCVVLSKGVPYVRWL
jgi:hypothetical protein